MKLKAPRPGGDPGPSPASLDGRAATSGGRRPQPISSGIAFRVAALRHQMRLRGLTGAALARLARVSDATISNALAGRRLHPATARSIAAAMATVELVPGLDALVAPEDSANG